MNTAVMTYPQHAKAVLVLGLPLVGGHLAQFAIGLTDTIMMGWYGYFCLNEAVKSDSVGLVLVDDTNDLTYNLIRIMTYSMTVHH